MKVTRTRPGSPTLEAGRGRGGPGSCSSGQAPGLRSHHHLNMSEIPLSGTST